MKRGFNKSCHENTNLAPDGNRPVEDAVHAQDGRLWRVDDGCAEHGAKHPPVADGEGASVHVLHRQLVITCLDTEFKRIQLHVNNTYSTSKRVNIN